MDISLHMKHIYSAMRVTMVSWRARERCPEATLMLSCSFTPSAVLAVLPLVLSPRELIPLLLGGPVCAC